jgi:hypothetical protein
MTDDPARSDAEEAATDDGAEDADGKESTFLVTHVESDSAIIKDVHDGQVHTLATNPGLEVDDAIEATVAPDPPMEVTYRVIEVAERRQLSIEESEEPPTVHERELAAETPTGELARERHRRCGRGRDRGPRGHAVAGRPARGEPGRDPVGAGDRQRALHALTAPASHRCPAPPTQSRSAVAPDGPAAL